GLVGKAGGRVTEAAAFFQGAVPTALTPDEIIVEIRLPAWPAGRRWGFEEFARRRGDFAMAAAAVFYDQDESGKARNAHVGVIGVAHRPPPLAPAADRPQRRALHRGAQRQGRGGRLRRRRPAGRYPCQRRLPSRARRNAGRTRAQARSRLSCILPIPPCRSDFASTGKRSRSKWSRGLRWRIACAIICG